MKIAFISLGFDPLRLSGADIVGERLVSGLLEHGHSVTIIAGKKSEAAEVIEHPALRFVRLNVGPSDWIGFSLQAGRLINRNPSFDVVHFWDVHFGFACRRPFLATVHHSFRQRLESIAQERPEPISWIRSSLYYRIARRFAEGPALKKALGLMAVSETTRNEFISNYGVLPEKILLTREGVDSEFFSPVSDTGSFRARLGIPETAPVLLFTGFITPRKHLEVLAQAFPYLPPGTVLLLAGRWRNESYRQRVLEAFGPYLSQVIQAGFVADADMPALYSLADLYVSSSLMEGFGLPLAEALACGTPVVAADVGAVSEVVGPGGILVPPRNPHSLGEAITDLLADPARRVMLGRLGRDHIRANFGMDTMVRDVLGAYRTFLRGQGNSS